MARRKRAQDEDSREPVYTDDGPLKLAHQAHHHLAEIYGDSQTQGLRPWARERVMSLVGATA